MLKAKVREEKLWGFMVKSNLSEAELGRRLGISRSYVSLLLCGRRYPSPNLRGKLMELLGVSFDELFTLED